MIYESITKCRVSKKKDLVSVGKFDGMSLTGTFPKSKSQKIPYLPFEVVYSRSSKLLQLKHNYNPKLLYGDNYGYLSSLNPLMVNPSSVITSKNALTLPQDPLFILSIFNF